MGKLVIYFVFITAKCQRTAICPCKQFRPSSAPRNLILIVQNSEGIHEIILKNNKQFGYNSERHSSSPQRGKPDMVVRTLREISRLSGPQISIPSSYFPIFSKYAFLSENRPPDMVGLLQHSQQLTYGPRREKTCLRGFRKSETQTSLLSYRD